MRLLCLQLAIIVMLTAAVQLGDVPAYAGHMLNWSRRQPVEVDRSLAQEATGALSGEVFMDTNRNGIRELAEDGVADAQITIMQIGGDTNGQTTSDRTGYYFFDDLPEGDYRVTVTPPYGYRLTTSGIVTVTIGSVQGPVTVATGMIPDELVFFPIIHRPQQ